jgi:glycerol uptake facilitator-like aquaporin
MHVMFDDLPPKSGANRFSNRLVRDGTKRGTAASPPPALAAAAEGETLTAAPRRITMSAPAWPRGGQIAREAFSTALWVSFSLATFVAANSARARSWLAIPPDASPESVLLAAVAGQFALCTAPHPPHPSSVPALRPPPSPRSDARPPRPPARRPLPAPPFRPSQGDYCGLALGSTLNPALALSFFMAGRLGPDELPRVLAGQLAGHLLAVRAARAVAADRFVSELRLFALPAPTAANGLSFAAAVAVEAALTCTLAVATLAAARLARASRGQSAGMLALVLAITAAGQGTTGALLNPAMALSLAVFERGPRGGLADRDLLVYFLGPCAGAVLGATAFGALFPDRRKRRIMQVQRQREQSQQQQQQQHHHHHHHRQPRARSM